MGVCGSFRNLTDVSFYNCTLGDDGNDPANLTCVYDYAGRNQSENLVEMTWVVTEPNGDGKQRISEFTWFRSAATTHTDEIGGKSFSMTSVRVRNTEDSPSDGGLAPPTEMLQSNWYLCQQTYEEAVIDSGTLLPGKVSSEPLVPVRNRTIPASKTGYLYDENIITYRADSTGLEYTTVAFPLDRIYKFLTKALENRFGLYGNASYVDSGNNDILALGYYLNITDLKSMTDDLAGGLSAQMRGKSPGDNKNLTMFGGDAFAVQTYIRVRWQWMMLPLVEVVLAALLLAATIFETRAGPLLKSSVTAFFLHGLDGWDAADVRAGSLETTDDLDRRSRAMIAAFAEDEDGWLRFAKHSRHIVC
ncbi:hypothetical protein UCDDA912_g07473 [Diaporthe ampelina]|uniref:Uncharacterized protein n=1 Tax=Diaporthe ampelina TaxID=1214573 RepID=A0A0G2FEK1_9PEZI|nr:hypothetical protein UCDDA912_g07473 [Diaporthe ampelina]